MNRPRATATSNYGWDSLFASITGSIPARAGKPFYSVSPLARVPVYPRPCGEAEQAQPARWI